MSDCQVTNLLSPEADEVDRQWALQFMKAMLPSIGAKAGLVAGKNWQLRMQGQNLQFQALKGSVADYW